MSLRHLAPVGMLTGMASVVWAALTPLTPRLPSPVSPPQFAPPHSAPYRADSLARVIVAADAFRMDRRPLARAYEVARVGAPAAPVPLRPTLTLVGLVAGDQGTAVIDGLPGIEGSRVMRLGEVVAGFRLARIEGNRAVVIGMDTTWVLTVREPWR